MQKPFDIDTTYKMSELPTKLQEILMPQLYGKGIPVTSVVRPITGQEIFDLLGTKGGADQSAKTLQSIGYDGITHSGGKISGGKPHRVYIAFSPDQVVSAFDPSLQPQAVTGGTPLVGGPLTANEIRVKELFAKKLDEARFKTSLDVTPETIGTRLK
jgi:hypothetical protein